MEGPEIPPKHLKLTENKQGEAHDSPQDKFRLRPGFVNKITLMHNSTHFFFTCLWLLLLYNRMIE